MTVHEYAAALRSRYRAARRREQGKILDEFGQTTGLHRKAAIRLLNAGVRLKPVARGRSRRYRKNDQAYVEQRNWLSVRRHVGYDRYRSQIAYELLGRLYPLLRLQLNFFRPVRKLVGEERLGAKVSKRYDEPQTPYQRLQASGILEEDALAKLEEQSLAVNPAALERTIDQLLRQLWRLGQEERGKQEGLGNTLYDASPRLR